jgi:hypothetical protein
VTPDTYTLLIFLAGVGAGVGLTIVVQLSRDLHWIVRRLYRFARYHEHPPADDVPPSIRPYYTAILRDLVRQGRLTSPQPPAAHAAGK